MPRTWSALAGATVVGALLAALPAAASAQLFEPSQGLTPFTFAEAIDQPAVGVSGAGTTLTATPVPDGDGVRHLTLRTLNAAGTLSRPVQGSNFYDGLQNTTMAMAENGGAIIAWMEAPAGGPFKIYARMRSAAGALGPVRLVSADARNDFIDVAIDEHGHALVAWHQTTPASDIGVFVRQLDASSTLGAAVQLTAAGEDAGPLALAMDHAGDAVVSWVRISNPGNQLVARLKPAGGAWAVSKRVSDMVPFISDTAVGMTGTGQAWFAWRDASSSTPVIDLRSRTLAGTLSTFRQISTTGEAASEPALSVADTGEVAVAWLRDDVSAGHVRVAVRRRAAAGGLFPERTVSEADDDANTPAVTIAGDGTITVVWQWSPGSGLEMHGLRLEPNGADSGIESFSTIGEFGLQPVMATNGAGLVAVVWREVDDFSFNTRFAVTRAP